MAYTTSQAARLLGVSRNTLLRWFREGRVSDGPRDRNGWRLFGETELETLRAYVQRPAPSVQPSEPDQRRERFAGFLTRVPMLRGLPMPALLALGGLAQFQGVLRGRPVYAQGEPSRGLYIVVKGRIRLFRLSLEGREQTLSIVEPYSTFGESGMFSTPARHAHHAMPVQASTVIMLPTAGVRRVCLEHPLLAQALLGEFSRRISELEDRLEAQALLSLEQRLARCLLEGERSHWTLAELASYLGVARETLSRLVQRWCKEGLIERPGGRLRVLDSERLSRI